MVVVGSVQLGQVEVGELLYCIQVQVIGYYWVVDEVVFEELQVWVDIQFCVYQFFVVWVVVFVDIGDVIEYQYWIVGQVIVVWVEQFVVGVGQQLFV